MPVDSAREDYTHMCEKWCRVRDCYNGRDAILHAGNKYVPDLVSLDSASVNQLSMNTTNPNDAYRKRGSFYNATQRTVQGLTGAIFQKAPEVSFPPSIATYLDDITLTNIPFEMFSVDTGREVMITGRYGILIDMPLTGSKIRPYCVGYQAENITNWKSTRVDGVEVLTLLVLKEDVQVYDANDSFVSKTLIQYRVLEMKDKKCTVQLWRETEKDSGKFVEFEKEVTLMRRGVALDFIPFVFIGSTHATEELELPPLIDLADVNISHWRNSVDFEYGLHLVALPTPWVSGAKGQPDGVMKIGPSVVWVLEVQGSAGMLEFSGAGLKAIEQAMIEKQKQMSTLGARLLEEPVRGDTATAVLIRHSGENASLRSIAGSIEQGLTRVLQIVSWWDGLNAEIKDPNVGVELNKEYLDVKATAQEVQAALTALQAGEISFETWYAFIQSGGWAREGIDSKQELKDIGDDKIRNPPLPVEPPIGAVA